MGLSRLGMRWTRIIPASFLMYTIAFMDRVNIGFATQGMAHDFHVGATAIGITLGAFFIGYMVLQIPGGYIADRWGVRLWVTVLLVIWAVFAILSGLAQTFPQEIIARFFLGVAEGGIWPAVMVLLSKWFPQTERASANTLFSMSLPLGALLSAPLSGWLVGWLGWRHMLVLEGLPPLIWAVVWWFAIADTPGAAKWLPNVERAFLSNHLDREHKQFVPLENGVAWKALLHPVVWLIAIIYFFSVMGVYGLGLWGPTIVKSMGVSALETGILLAIPNLVGLTIMIYTGRLADRLQNRKMVVACSLLAALSGLILMAFVKNASIGFMVFFITIATAGFNSRQGPLWAIPSQILAPGASGVAFALIGLIGNLGGFAGPWLMGYVRESTHSFVSGLLALAGCVAVATVLVLLVPDRKVIDLNEFNVRFWRLRAAPLRPGQ